MLDTILTPDDLRAGELVDPGWYPCRFEDIVETIRPEDKSINLKFLFKVIEPAKYKGVEINKYVNEKGLKYEKAFWETLGVPVDPKGNFQISTSFFEKLKEQNPIFEIYIKRSKFNDRDNNSFGEIRRIKAQAKV